MYTLEILAENDEVKAFYNERANLEGDAGVDLYVPETNFVVYNQIEATLVDMKIKCRMLNEAGKTISYYLYPRSSIAKTPLVLANSVGIIDSSYRGNIKAAFRSGLIKLPPHEQISTEEFNTYFRYEISKGTRLVQICAPD